MRVYHVIPHTDTIYIHIVCSRFELQCTRLVLGEKASCTFPFAWSKFPWFLLLHVWCTEGKYTGFCSVLCIIPLCIVLCILVFVDCTGQLRAKGQSWRASYWYVTVLRESRTGYECRFGRGRGRERARAWQRSVGASTARIRVHLRTDSLRVWFCEGSQVHWCNRLSHQTATMHLQPCFITCA